MRVTKLSEFVSGRVKEGEKARIKQRADELGVTESDFVRMAVLAAIEADPETMFLAGEIAAVRGMLHNVTTLLLTVMIGDDTASLQGANASLVGFRASVDSLKDEAAMNRWRAFAEAHLKRQNAASGEQVRTAAAGQE